MATDYNNLYIVRRALESADEQVLDDISDALERLLPVPTCCDDPVCYPMKVLKFAGWWVAEMPHDWVMTYSVGAAFPRSDETINVRTFSPMPNL